MTLKQTQNLVAALLTMSIGLLGLTFLMGTNPSALKAVFVFYGVGDVFSDGVMGTIAGVPLILVALLVLLTKLGVISRNIAVAFAVAVISAPLLTLFSPSRWMTDLGGFPIIGNGQGIIKYFAIIPLLLFLFYREKFTERQLIWANYAPVAMVLLWIGGMKFFEFEANGIVSLVETSPFMSWLYVLFSVQGASNAIGIFDVLFAVLLGIGLLLNKKILVIIGGLAALSVFLMTQTFIFTVPETLDSITLFNLLSQFVIKDLWFVANLAVVGFYALQDKTLVE
ncbi:DUF417 family protein [Alteromonas gracilis]|uniref:DUF417 family protein n=1 Tax=Alteromonas gracilis TaxID=1479524 RepID=UPI003219968E